MKPSARYVIFLVAILYISCATTAQISTIPPPSRLSGNQLIPLGRFDMQDSRLELISSAAHFGVEFEGAVCTLTLSTNPSQIGYLQYELDGVYQQRVRVEGQIMQIPIASTTSGKHTLRVYKTTEAHTGPIFVHEVVAEKVKSLEIPARPLIEFIGNSITCGAAADPSEIPCGTGSYHDQHNAYMAYGPRVARMLNANFVLTSVSGIGIYRNWNTDGPTMPQVYENTDLREGSGRRWNFNTFSPTIVSIALGTNDFSNGDGKTTRLPFDSATYTNQYIAFVKTVKAKYPNAKISLLNSPMVSGTRNEVFVDCLDRVKREIDNAFPSDIPVCVFVFNPMKARGCGGHPNVEDHEVMAAELVDFFRPMINTK